MLTCLKRGDAVLNAKRTENLLSMSENPNGYIQRQIRKLNEESAAERGMAAGGQTMNEYHVTVNMNNVNDYEDIFTKLQYDPRTERFVQAVSVDMISGKTHFRKYSI